MSQPIKITEVPKRSPQLIAQLVDVWEASVRKTHLFLSPEQIEEIKGYVPYALAEVEHLVVVESEAATESGRECESETSRILGFMGVQDRRLEMLFLAPDAREKGIGRQLLELGIRDYSICELTVNEQNPQAVGFYQHLGFRTYKRTDHDEQGAPYPLLYMRLALP